MKFLLKRVIICLCTIVVSTVFVFWAIRLMPGSPIARLVGYENYSETTAKYLTEKYGLDEPIAKQFKIYVKNILKGDFGYSYINNKPVWNIISEKIVPTILLIIPATIISFIIGIWLALKSIYNKKTAWFFDKFSAVISSWPTYVLTLLLLYIFSFKLNIFPISGLNNSRIVSQGIYGILDTIIESMQMDYY